MLLQQRRTTLSKSEERCAPESSTRCERGKGSAHDLVHNSRPCALRLEFVSPLLRNSSLKRVSETRERSLCRRAIPYLLAHDRDESIACLLLLRQTARFVCGRDGAN